MSDSQVTAPETQSVVSDQPEIDLTPNFMPDDPYSIPISEYDVSDPTLFVRNKHWGFLKRLREEEPVHFCQQSMHGPYWSLTRYEDIMYVDTNHKKFSSEPAITVAEPQENFPLPMFIAMDQPKHGIQRKTVSPSMASQNLAKMEGLIRERLVKIMDELPIGETFNWVERVSIELTTQMLATLFDFPFEERHKLTRWSDVTTATPESSLIESEEQRKAELMECLAYFTNLWNERVNAEPKNDLISMLAHGESTRNMDPEEYLGNLLLLIVGGNDTTRNSISGGVMAMNKFPDQYTKVSQNPDLIPKMVSEIIRWQTPLTHMRRIALEDVEIGGKKISKGDKIVMWYISGNRDESVFPNAGDFIIDRGNVRQHIAFGYGIHRCMGNRLAEMQLKIVWEEILKRFKFIEVVAEPVRVHSSFVHGYLQLLVKIQKL